MKKYLIALSVGVGGALLILGLLLLGYALVADPPTPQPSMSGDVCSRIMPDDVGQRVVIWLRYNGDGGYSLDWEKHQVVTTGMASVPVSVE